jgi:hypothetical protein
MGGGKGYRSVAYWVNWVSSNLPNVLENDPQIIQLETDYMATFDFYTAILTEPRASTAANTPPKTFQLTN